MQRMFEGIVSSKEWRDRVCGGREFLLPLQGHWEGISRIDILHKDIFYKEHERLLDVCKDIYSTRIYSTRGYTLKDIFDIFYDIDDILHNDKNGNSRLRRFDTTTNGSVYSHKCERHSEETAVGD